MRKCEFPPQGTGVWEQTAMAFLSPCSHSLPCPPHPQGKMRNEGRRDSASLVLEEALSDWRIDLKRTQLQNSQSFQEFLFYLFLNKYFTLPLPFIFLSGCGSWTGASWISGKYSVTELHPRTIFFRFISRLCLALNCQGWPWTFMFCLHPSPDNLGWPACAARFCSVKLHQFCSMLYLIRATGTRLKI